MDVVETFKLKIAALQNYTLMVGELLRNLPAVLKYRRDVLREMYLIGTQAFWLILFGGFFTGLIMAMEVGHKFQSFGAITLIGRTTAFGMLRELGPIITGLLMAARTGAKNTSEIGSMVLSEQVDALRAYGTNPVLKLVLPRTVAALLMFLPLTMVANTGGFAGGLLVSSLSFHVDVSFFMESAFNGLLMKDLFIGSLKPLVFGFFIATISSYYGLSVKDGTVGLGRNTVNAVVVSSMIVLALDFIFTKIVWELI